MSKKVFTVFSLLLAIVMIVSVTQPAFSSNEGKMRVWVEFSPGNSARVEKSLQAMGAEFHYRFEDLNSFVVTVPEQALVGLRNNPNVVSIEEDAIRYPAGETYPDVPYGIDMVQARDVWDTNRDGTVDAGAPTGADITVCIIDSGIYAGHEDFGGVNIVGGYTNISGTTYFTDGSGHGTHVAGTITAALNEKGVVGVSPGKVSLFIVKVFGDDGLWAYSSTLADAANRCSNAGAKIISMSLGGAQKSKLEERAFNNLYSAGILSIAAAGNEGTTAYNYPASYSSVISVAAVDANKVVADFSQYNNQVELAAPGVSVMSTVPFLSEASVTVDGATYVGNLVEFAALGTVDGALVSGDLCTSIGPWSGKVVLCQRGDISFYDKVMNVQNSGGKAAIIYNNVEGELFATLGAGFSSTIPAIGLSSTQGSTLLQKVNSIATVKSSFTPNVSAYEAWNGTSMATPHVSGVAALVWSANPNWTNEQIRNALTSTAEDLGSGGRDVYYGYGLVQAYDALVSLGWNPPSPTPTPTNTPTPTPTNTPTPTPTNPPTTTPEPSGTMEVTVSTNSSYSINETVTINVTATDNSSGTAIVGASVNVVVKNARGKTIASLNDITNSLGTSSHSFTITRSMGTGTYSVTATVNKENFNPGSGTKTFTVQ